MAFPFHYQVAKSNTLTFRRKSDYRATPVLTLGHPFFSGQPIAPLFRRQGA